jgi:hypothetical protein
VSQMHDPSQIGGPGFTRAPVALALHLIDLVPVHVGAGIEDNAKDVRCRWSYSRTLTAARPEVSPDEHDPPMLAEEPPVHGADPTLTCEYRSSIFRGKNRRLNSSWKATDRWISPVDVYAAPTHRRSNRPVTSSGSQTPPAPAVMAPDPSKA